MSLAPDCAGDIYEGRVRPIGDEAQVYTQRFWPYIDIYGSWHGQLVASVPADVVRNPDAPVRTYGVVDIPNPGWTEAAHKNGARTLGGCFWLRPDRFENFVQRDPDGSFPVGRKLVGIKQYFGFDGYFINQEDAVSPAQIKALFAMFRYMKSLDADLYLQYYDADLPGSGELDYQNEINERNVGSLGTVSDPVADSIFINYGWPYADKDLSGSAATVAGRGFDPRKAAVASTECQQGGFNPAEDFGSVASPGHAAPVSWALFVENQIWADAAKEGITATAGGRAQYRDLERKFWSGPAGDPSQSGRAQARKPPYRTDVLNYKVWDGVAHSIVEKSAISALPLVTNFNIGVGTHLAVAGETVGSKAWNNAGIAEVAPTWQYWTEHAGGATSAFVLD
ncbi:endo-beta-N-acetylglucosaminidase [Arthrobacter terrae]|uniref:endo-beta-N-acetylglucosaminidase n=1 Tax=Arthrobacter terrae TaxID=2935737 RepID=UPI0028AEF512|nr:hypothetical protein [Arthrobacter terrae]